MKKYLICILLISNSIFGQKNDIQKSVVKIFTAKQSYNFNEPWKSNSIRRSRATGFVIANNRIITNAHAISNYRYLQVRFGNSPKKINVEVEYISDDYDLAILKFENSKEIPKLIPLEFNTVLKLKEKVVVYGYPIGGDELSITEGIISRIQLSKYVYSQKTFTTIQTDAAINPGNSGGPVIINNKVIGIAFQGIKRASNIGYIIPSHIINHFLNDIEDGKYDGIPTLGFKWRPLESSIHRKMLGMNEDETGILIKSINKNSYLNKILEKNDVLLKIDNKKIGIDGSIEFSRNSRIGFSYILENKKYDDTIIIEFLRNKKRLTKKITINKSNKNAIIESYNSNTPPTYYITSGFIFEKLSVNYLNQFLKSRRKQQKHTQDLINLIDNHAKDIDEIVFIVSVLPDISNEGYQNLKNIPISEINGVKIKNFKEFISILKTKRYAVLKDLKGNQIVIDNDLSKERDEIIKKTYNISSLISNNLTK